MDQYKYINSRGEAWYLNKKSITLKNNIPGQVYYFTREAREGTGCRMPFGWEIKEIEHGSHMPFIRKQRSSAA